MLVARGLLVLPFGVPFLFPLAAPHVGALGEGRIELLPGALVVGAGGEPMFKIVVVLFGIITRRDSCFFSRPAS
jgi:hypothetical protein